MSKKFLIPYPKLTYPTTLWSILSPLKLTPPPPQGLGVLDAIGKNAIGEFDKVIFTYLLIILYGFWQSVFDKVIFDKVIFDKVFFDKLIFDKVIFDKVIFDKVIFDKVIFDKVIFDKVIFDKVIFDKVIFDKVFTILGKVLIVLKSHINFFQW